MLKVDVDGTPKEVVVGNRDTEQAINVVSIKVRMIHLRKMFIICQPPKIYRQLNVYNNWTTRKFFSCLNEFECTPIVTYLT